MYTVTPTLERCSYNIMKSSSTEQLLRKRTRSNRFVLVIHGGAGAMTKSGSTPEQVEAYHAALRSALQAGFQVLQEGGEALDAAVAAVTVMEDNVLFNAGKGAVFNIDGKNELEASIMLSKPPSSHPEIPASRRGIGLTLTTRLRNPSQAARALYLAPVLAPHTLLSGNNAEHIAESLGQKLVDPSYFFTEQRWREHRRGLGLPEEPFPPGTGHPSGGPFAIDMFPTGTVGAVALDIRGCICAVTSTGGRTNKLAGRIGDTPLMASGFWSEQWESNNPLEKMWAKLRGTTCAKAVGISSTGDGDYFIRHSTASSIAQRMKHKKETLRKASAEEVEALLRDGGLGGVIALDHKGRVAMPLNCPGMYRGVIRQDGIPKTAIFNDDILA